VGRTSEYEIWYTTGPIQVLASDSEVWLFLEFDRQISKGSHGYDYPGVYPVGHFQDVIILDRDGLKNRIRIGSVDNLDGMSLHRNHTRIFRFNDTFYSYSSPSMFYKESIFEWDEIQERFLLLEIQEASAILNELPTRETFWDSIVAVDAKTKESGWEALYQDYAIGEDIFEWNGEEYSITATGTKHSINVEIQSSGNLSLTFEYKRGFEIISKDVLESLSSVERGHPRDN